MKVISVVLVALALIGCDNRVCLKSHSETYTYLMPVLTGFVNNIPQYMYIPQTGETTVCDVYEERSE